MFGSRRPDGSAARARLRALTPRWVPTQADIQDAARGLEIARVSEPQSLAKADDDGSSRHALPEAPRPVWRIDGAAARGLLSLGLAAVAGALVVVVMGWPRGSEVNVDSDSSDSGTSASPANILTQPSPSASGMLVVDVDGKVHSPGVVELSTGSRVIDAIKAAGGVTRHGDTGALNLAEVLIDGQQVVVPAASADESVASGVVPGETPGSVAPVPTSAAATVSINSASTTELEVLPGIGPVLAAAIVEWRTQNGGFTSIEQLQEVSGIGPATYAELAPHVRL